MQAESRSQTCHDVNFLLDRPTRHMIRWVSGWVSGFIYKRKRLIQSAFHGCVGWETKVSSNPALLMLRVFVHKCRCSKDIPQTILGALQVVQQRCFVVCLPKVADDSIRFEVNIDLFVYFHQVAIFLGGFNERPEVQMRWELD